MTLDERLSWLLLGVVIGCYMSYVTGSLREIKEELSVVGKILNARLPRKRDERGAWTVQKAKNFALLIVVLLTAFSAVRSQIASNKADENTRQVEITARQLDRIVTCNKNVLSDALDVLNTRSTYSQSQASANLILQKAFSTLFTVLLHEPPYPVQTQVEATKTYQAALQAFIHAGTKAKNNAQVSKYPEAQDLVDCIDASEKVTKKEE